ADQEEIRNEINFHETFIEDIGTFLFHVFIAVQYLQTGSILVLFWSSEEKLVYWPKQSISLLANFTRL
ncbi:hypothetical protein Bpfe_018414, partial [Biomphalaria pfeifferi]